MLKVNFYETVEDEKLKFAVILARTKGKWVFCKHKERDTWEVPGGHREPGEDILQTAKRELYEETGAVDFELRPVCVYSVADETDKHTGNTSDAGETEEHTGNMSVAGETDKRTGNTPDAQAEESLQRRAGSGESFGMLYAAEINAFETELHSEIEKIIVSEELPEKWTYPLIQPKLLEEAKKRGMI